MVIEEIPPVVKIRSAVSAASLSSARPHKMMDMPRHKIPKGSYLVLLLQHWLKHLRQAPSRRGFSVEVTLPAPTRSASITNHD